MTDGASTPPDGGSDFSDWKPTSFGPGNATRDDPTLNQSFNLISACPAPFLITGFNSKKTQDDEFVSFNTPSNEALNGLFLVFADGLVYCVVALNGSTDAGGDYHEVRFEAADLASGVYVYRLHAGGH